MFVVVTYDISDEKRLRRVAKEMENWGERVQKSVFECDFDEKNFSRMRKRLRKLINMQEDSIRFYFLCKTCREKIQVDGKGKLYEREETVVV